MAIYLLYEGIKGNVTADGYKDHIQIASLQFGVGRGVSMEPGNLANREATRPSVSEVTISKTADNSVTDFFRESVVGSAGKTAKFKFVQTGTDKVIKYMNIDLFDTIVSGYSISAPGDGDPMESISISFSKIEVNYNDFDTANKNSNPQRVGYDLATAKPI